MHIDRLKFMTDFMLCLATTSLWFTYPIDCMSFSTWMTGFAHLKINSIECFFLFCINFNCCMVLILFRLWFWSNHNNQYPLPEFNDVFMNNWNWNLIINCLSNQDRDIILSVCILFSINWLSPSMDAVTPTESAGI